MRRSNVSRRAFLRLPDALPPSRNRSAADEITEGKSMEDCPRCGEPAAPSNVISAAEKRLRRAAAHDALLTGLRLCGGCRKKAIFGKKDR